MKFRVFLLVIFLSGIYIFFLGDSGIIKRLSLLEKLAGIERKIDILKSDNQFLAQEIQGLKKSNFSTQDLLDNGFIGPDEKVLIDPNQIGKITLPKKKHLVLVGSKSLGYFNLELKHLRILWIVFSVFLVLWYLSRNRKFFHLDSS